MKAGAVACHPVRIDGASVPNRTKRVDRRRHNATRGPAIGCRDKADTAGIGLEFWSVHALLGEAEALIRNAHATFLSLPALAFR